VAGRPKKGEATLTLDKIIDAAWDLVDREGLKGLSTRSLAATLNVKSPALYWHFKSKDELQSLMAERILEGTISSVPTDVPWWDWMFVVGKQQRQTLLSHRDSGFISATAEPTKRLRDELFESAIQNLMRAGFDRERAASAFGGLARLVLGSVLYEQNPHTRAFAAIYGNADAHFEYVLAAYIRGLRADLAP
jgi:TetR/AcrR family tetracycline transcriptional repressor